MNFDEYISRIFKISFSLKEITSIILTTIIISIISSFRLWGNENPNLQIGLNNLLTHSITNLCIIFIYVTIMKIFFSYNYSDYEYKYSKYGLLISFLIAFGSNGLIRLYSPGWGEIKQSKNRLGKLFFKQKIEEYQRSLFFSSVIMMFIAFLISSFNELFFKQTMLIIIFSVLPIPDNFGFLSFYSNKKKHIILMLFIILSFLSWIFIGNIFSIIFSLVFTIILITFIFRKLDIN